MKRGVFQNAAKRLFLLQIKKIDNFLFLNGRNSENCTASGLCRQQRHFHAAVWCMESVQRPCFKSRSHSSSSQHVAVALVERACPSCLDALHCLWARQVDDSDAKDTD